MVGVDDELLTLRELANLLNNVPGRVMIILDSCFSGQGIYNNKGYSGSSKSSPNNFNQMVINTFAAADPGLYITDPDVPQVGSGELRTNKFYVLTASAYNELSKECQFSGSSLWFGIFTRGIIDGTGYSYQLSSYGGKSPADTNNDKKFTLRELFYYAKAYVKNYFPDQNVQWYPMGAVFTILVKN